MILYLDTSSLIKLYVEEAGSRAVRELVAGATLAATSVVAYPEARSALARLHREGWLAAVDHERVRADFDRDWRGLLSLPLREPLWRQAGDLAERHGLRGFDSIHLASYLSLLASPQGVRVEFSSFDDRLNRAARLETG
ncbi:MAG: type II toxin-antitoxin system VapC family toxin [Acidobacteriota bacterium]|nr:type II toxin-antitoxin system VapC family toxin [Acidobacteriota bacterium]